MNGKENGIMKDDCRKAFEDWAKDKQEDLCGLEWMAWQAAYNRPKAEVDEAGLRVAILKSLPNCCYEDGFIKGEQHCYEMLITAIRPYLAPCADVAGLVEKLESRKENAAKWRCLVIDEDIATIKQHFEVKP